MVLLQWYYNVRQPRTSTDFSTSNAYLATVYLNYANMSAGLAITLVTHICIVRQQLANRIYNNIALITALITALILEVRRLLFCELSVVRLSNPSGAFYLPRTVSAALQYYVVSSYQYLECIMDGLQYRKASWSSDKKTAFLIRHVI